jgi:pectate lyase
MDMDKYRKLAHWLVLLLVLTLATHQTSEAQGNIKAFPGAEGHGTYTTHGRGGEVIAVTNLNDAGTGSLRDAVSKRGPRIIVFEVSGTIRLDSHIRIKNPYVYIAGQTAPGDGIALQGAGLIVETHNVLIRFLRVRPGDARRGPAGHQRDAIAVAKSGIYNVVIDHNSFSWAVDENTSIWYPAQNVTYSWNIISEGLMDSIHREGKHSMGMLIGRDAQNISIHHNLFAHNNERNPMIKANTSTDIVNNVIYNWGKQGLTSAGRTPVYTNIVNNYFKKGPDSQPWEFFINNDGSGPPGSSEFYLSGNIGPNRPNNNMDEWAISRFAPGRYRHDRPHRFEPVTTWSAVEAYERVLEGAGAIYPGRDAVDHRIVNDVREGGGRIIDRVSQTPGYPTLRSATPPRDTDGDGMPDSWECERGLNPGNPNDNIADRNNDGYTNIEEYINELAGDSNGSASVGQEMAGQHDDTAVGDIALVSYGVGSHC